MMQISARKSFETQLREDCNHAHQREKRKGGINEQRNQSIMFMIAGYCEKSDLPLTHPGAPYSKKGCLPHAECMTPGEDNRRHAHFFGIHMLFTPVQLVLVA